MSETSIYWDDSFRQEMEQRSIEEGLLVWALGGPSFALRTPEAMVYLDPYFGGVPATEMPGMYRTSTVPVDPAKITVADAVLMTHAHLDHCHEPTLTAMAAGTSVRFYGPSSTLPKMLGCALPQDRVSVLKAGDRLDFADVTVTVWPANDPGEPEAVTFVVATQGVKAFFAGDSMPGPAVESAAADGDLDIVMLAFGRTWYMSAAALLDEAEKMGAKLLLPYHWDIWRGHTGDPLLLGRLVEQRKPSYAVELLLPGQSVHYLPDGDYTSEG